MKIRCMAIDDEPIALEKLKKYIEDVPYLELVAACRGTHEASAILDEGNVDAVFIDINGYRIGHACLIDVMHHVGVERELVVAHHVEQGVT